jgi:hypothetical protein
MSLSRCPKQESTSACHVNHQGNNLSVLKALQTVSDLRCSPVSNTCLKHVLRTMFATCIPPLSNLLLTPLPTACLLASTQRRDKTTILQKTDCLQSLFVDLKFPMQPRLDGYPVSKQSSLLEFPKITMVVHAISVRRSTSTSFSLRCRASVPSLSNTSPFP